MSVLIFARVLGWKLVRWKPSVSIVGAGGGFLDAVGGGGWDGGLNVDGVW
jgi:uncharacterized protein